ncbi:MAG: pimeloyl-ACP methyl ester carboxylesterase [Phenylobacterium sp.]|jgi:pimeloyl-ACP methyl ester carboxylesterase
MAEIKKELRFTLPHLNLAGWSNGKEGKPVVLALHGWLDNAGSFEPLLPWLDDYHVFAVDFPGHGLSDHRSVDAHYHFVEWINDVAELIRVMGWDDVMLLGHSMGGMIASVVAAVLPEQINRLVLLDAIGVITTPQESACDQLRQAITSRRRIAKQSVSTHPTFDSALSARVAAGDLSPTLVRLLLKRGLKEVADGFCWRSDPKLRSHSAMRFSFEQAKSFITEIKCPVLLIEGQTGFKLSSKAHQLFVPLYPNLLVREISGGHHCHMQFPEQVYKAMIEDQR